VVEVERTFDVVRLSALRSILTDAGIDSVVFDAAAGALWTGAIPSRLVVHDEDIELARRAIALARI
jgi:hypothetical protein